MASKVDEDSEERNKSVAEHLSRNKQTNDGCVAGQEEDNKDGEETAQLTENTQIVDEVINNFSGDESESESFQDAVEDFSLNEKLDSCRATADGGENNAEVKDDSGEAEEEEILTPEEKEVCQC